jgi:hypothetical protein
MSVNKLSKFRMYVIGGKQGTDHYEEQDIGGWIIL